MKIYTPSLQFHTATRDEFTQNKSLRYIAVEIEVAKADYGQAVNNVASAWSAGIVEDGSLPKTGFEINTAPANGDRFIEQIQAFSKALKEQRAEVTTSCGLHVHIDARDFTYYDIRRLIQLYSAIESALFDMVPDSRKDNHYCIQCAEIYEQAIAKGKLPKESKQGIIQALYKTNTTKDRRTEKYNAARYYALNLHSWLYRGTVECRLFSGTVDSRKIINWGLLWASILDTAMRLTEAQIAALRKEKTGRSILRDLCPNDDVRAWVEERWSKFGR